MIYHAECCFCENKEIFKFNMCKECYSHLNLDVKFNALLPNVDDIVVAMQYNKIVRKIISDFKFRDKVYYYKFFADVMSEKLFENNLSKNYKHICYIPMHKSDEKRRGYNQSKLIAKGICENTMMDLVSSVEKHKRTKEQVNLSESERVINMTGAFRVMAKVPDNIIIVDDVITTGSTVNELAGVLKDGGAKKVAALIAATPSIL
ncbi:putative amidophosphoribosyltransferases [Peptoniphilus sp. ING2-D1G]|nr:putative amidophosphoribosyltransferases [Peptoniphilus sp. ING2-D1G]